MNDQTPNPDPLDEALSLVNALLDGRLDEPGARRLEELVLSRPDVRRLYVRYMHQECVIVPHRGSLAIPGALPEQATEEAELAAPRTLSIERHRQSLSWRRYSGIAAAIAIIMGLSIFLLTGNRRDEATTVATVSGMIGAQWDGQVVPAGVGTAITSSSKLQLKSGVVELAFASGAKVVVEGPATFTPDSSGQISLSAGQLTAYVPPKAVGFSVATPSGTIVDLGTEFGVSLESDGTTAVEVFTGRVKAQPGPQRRSGEKVFTERLLTAGQTARVSTGSVTLTPSPARRYVRSLAPDPTTRPSDIKPALTSIKTTVDLSTSFNRVGMTDDGKPNTSDGLDDVGSTYSSTQLAPLRDEFVLGKPGENNVVISGGQTITLPAKPARTLTFLGTGVKGKKPDLIFTVRYTDGSTESFTQSMSNWNTPSEFDGEAVALEAEYRNGGAGELKSGHTYVYRYTFALNGAKTVGDVTLPKDKRSVVFFAMNLTQ